MPIHLGYDPTLHTDGGGAQLHRALGIRVLARAAGLEFGSLAIRRIGYAGPARLGHDPAEQAGRWNEAFHLESCEEACEELMLDGPANPTFGQIRSWSLRTGRDQLIRGIFQDLAAACWTLARARWRTAFQELAASARLRIALAQARDSAEVEIRIAYPHRALDRHPELWDRFAAANRILEVPELPPRPRSTVAPIQIAVHIRRGDLAVRESWRSLDADYFKEVLALVVTELSSLSRSMHVTVYSDAVRRSIEWAVTGDSDFAKEFVPGTKIQFAAEPLPMSLFEGLPSVSESLLEDVESIRAMAQADILIGSRSSFSFVGGLLGSGLVIMPKFWHSLPPSWIEAPPTSNAEGRAAGRWKSRLSRELQSRFLITESD